MVGDLGEGGPSCGTARAKGQSDHEFGIWGKKDKKAKKSVWLDSMARGRGGEHGGGEDCGGFGSFRYLWALL